MYEQQHQLLMLQDMDAVKQKAIQLGLTVHHREKKETVINRILEVTSQIQPPSKDDIIKAEKKVLPPVESNDDELRLALDPYINAGVIVTIDKAENVFEFRKGVHVECGNLKQPLKNIVHIASQLARR